MANKSNIISNTNTVFASMQKELECVRHQLAMASKTLAEKDQMIGSLEDDLAHMVELLSNRVPSKECVQWMSSSVPGIAEA